jgi:hypothetical protein
MKTARIETAGHLLDFERVSLDDGATKPEATNQYDPLMFVASIGEVESRHRQLIENKDVLRAQLRAMYERSPELFPGRAAGLHDALARDRSMGEAFAAAIDQAHSDPGRGQVPPPDGLLEIPVF